MALCVVCSIEIRDEARFCPSCGAEQPKPGPNPGSGDDPLIGQVVARNFKIEKLLGVGGMGKVYKARQLSLDKVVVIKLLHDHFRDDPQLVQRFQREARAASRLNHPNSIQVIDFGQDEHQILFMAIEYLEGKDLFSVLRDQGPLEPERVARIMMQVCSALAEAHDQHVIHRDLKPENIMVEDRRGQRDFVKVLDFGIAKIQEPGANQAGQALTQAGMVCGTPEYMSPEQARGQQLDARSDLYSLGVVAYQLATGELPFTADTPIGIVTKHILEPPVPPRLKRPSLPEALEAAILRAMQKDAEQRFQSAIEMGEAFEALSRAAPPAAFSPAAPSPAAPSPALAPSGTSTQVGATATAASAREAPVLAEVGTASATAAAPSARAGAAAGPSSAGFSLSPNTATEDSQPAVRTVGLDGLSAATPHATVPHATVPHATVPTPPGLAAAASSRAGGGMRWAALAGVVLISAAGGTLYLFQDRLFGTGRPGRVAEAPNQELGSVDRAAASSAKPTGETAPGLAEAGEALEDPPKEPKPLRDPKPPARPPTKGDPPAERVAPVRTPSPSPRNPTREREPRGDSRRTPRGSAASSRRAPRGGGSAEARAKAKQLHQKANPLAVSKDPEDLREAVRLLNRAFNLDKSNPDPLRPLAFALAKLGEDERACRAIKDYVTMKRTSRAAGAGMVRQICGKVR